MQIVQAYLSNGWEYFWPPYLNGERTQQSSHYVDCSLMACALSVAWKYRKLPQAVICRPSLVFPDFSTRCPSPPGVPGLLALPQRRQVVCPQLRGRMRRLPRLKGSRLSPLELPPQLGLLLLGEPRRVGGAADGLAVRARGLAQAPVEHVGDLALEPGHVARAQPHHGAGYDVSHAAGGGAVHLQHGHGLLGEGVALAVRQVEAAADVLAGLAEEAAGQGELVVQLAEEGGHVCV